MNKEMENLKTLADFTLKKLLAFTAAAISSFVLQLYLSQNIRSIVLNLNSLLGELPIIVKLLLAIIPLIACVGALFFMSGVVTELEMIATIENDMELTETKERYYRRTISHFQFCKIYGLFYTLRISKSGKHERHTNIFVKISTVIIILVILILWILSEIQIFL